MSHIEAFMKAIERGDCSEVQALLAGHAGLATARDDTGATGLHYAAFNASFEIINALIVAGADVNARDGRYGATPAGWAVHTMRERGGLLAIEIEDVRFAIERGDADWVDRLVTRHPALRDAVDREGKPLRQYAEESSDPRIREAFHSHTSTGNA
jgi:hypothetical protein